MKGINLVDVVKYMIGITSSIVKYLDQELHKMHEASEIYKQYEYSLLLSNAVPQGNLLSIK